MSGLIVPLVTLAVCNVAWSAPTTDEPLPPTPPKSVIDFFANETAPTCTTLHIDEFTIKNGLIDTRYRWQNFNVYPDNAYNANERQAINNAMYNLMQVISCVKFGIYPPGSAPGGDYVYITKGSNNGCSSAVGKRGGRQNMNLQSPGCMSVGTIMHEMIHALGFHHEQCRPDRDDYVTIHWGNIQSGMGYNFDKLPSNQWSIFNVPYNQRSIMHYNTRDFSSNGLPTITAKNGQAVGSTGQLQASDKQKLKNMYRC